MLLPEFEPHTVQIVAHPLYYLHLPHLNLNIKPTGISNRILSTCKIFTLSPNHAPELICTASYIEEEKENIWELYIYIVLQFPGVPILYFTVAYCAENFYIIYTCIYIIYNNNNNNNIYLLQLGCYPVAVVILQVKKHEIDKQNMKLFELFLYNYFYIIYIVPRFGLK